MGIPVALSDEWSLSNIAIKKNDGTTLKIKICLSPECQKCEGLFFAGTTRCGRDQTMHFVHRDCWKLINTTKPTHGVMSALYKLARSIYPIFEDQDGSHELQMRIVENVLSTADAQTDLGKLFGYISELPAEVRAEILVYSQKPLSPLLTVLSTSAPLLDLIKQGDSGQGSIDVTCSDTIDSLSGQLLSIRGRRYISRLSFNETMGLTRRDHDSISVRTSAIKGVKFVVDCDGLRALSILYDDDSTSAWLGDMAGGWRGTMLGDIGRGFRVLQDVRSMKMRLWRLANML